MSAEWLFDRQWWASDFQGKINLATYPCHCQSNSSIFSLGNRRLCPARMYLVLTAPSWIVSLASGEQTVALTAPSTHALCPALSWAALPFQSLFFGIFQNLASETGFSAASDSSSHLPSCLSSHSSTPGPFSSHTLSMSSRCVTVISNHCSHAQTSCPNPYLCFPAEISN